MGYIKTIQFVRREYKPTFSIPDGGQILQCFPDGKKVVRTCKFIDRDHFMMDGFRLYHVFEFAEAMTKCGIRVMPFPEKHTIWSNIDLNLDDWIECLSENYPDVDEYRLTEIMYEVNDENLMDERFNLNIECGSDIIVFGDIGTWQGRADGYKIIESGNIADCLYSDCDLTEWYVDREGEFRSRQIHHDGTNHLYYRKFKNDLSYDDREDFLDKLSDGKATKEDIDHVTEKLGMRIAEVYGWEFPTQENERASVRDAR